MKLKLVFILATLTCYECGLISSSFWAPLFNPKILGYKVDIAFDPNAGKNAREEYIQKYGKNGEKLIADLSNGNGPNKEYKDYGDIQVYYTYDGANKRGHH
ncbi:uncharacterized protein LOC123664562 [Melitaea cinxia]|uniref:uncharacterized protein LOC123664562 n=1 Tax=Melitaea cinxia TaxID=113334 RepID=UPI001E26F10F|nr:uncharacterized protein LOC123664562 [Melitaea cinxia]